MAKEHPMTQSPTKRVSVALTTEQRWHPVPGGSGTYVDELWSALAGRDDVELQAIRARHALGNVPPLLPETVIPLGRRLLYRAWERRWGAKALPRVDVIHATTWAIPPAAAPLVVTVHDVAHLHVHNAFTARGARFFERALGITRDEAAAVIVPSQSTAADCLDAGIDRARITVIPHGVSVPKVPASNIAGFRAIAGLPEEYLLWVGTREPRKNLGAVLEAYRLLPDAPPLAIVGPQGWGTDATDGPLPEGVRVLGWLDRDDLHAAFAGAQAFVFPSLWEGFGMPVLEAMAHGVPAVTSAGTSMAEFADPEFLVNPYEPESIAAGIARALEDNGTRGAWAKAKAAEFTWEASAAAHAEVYRAARG